MNITVEFLISELQKLPPKANIFIESSHGEYSPVTPINICDTDSNYCITNENQNDFEALKFYESEIPWGSINSQGDLV